jgi:hypothetical protein
MAKYVSSGKFSGAGLVSLFGISIICAVVLGFLVYMVSLLFYLLLLFPIGWGLLLGLSASAGVKAGKCRNAALAALVALLCAGLTYATFHHLKNREVRKNIQGLIAKAAQEKTFDLQGASVESAYEQWLLNETGKKGFWGEMAFRAKAGMNISKTGSGSSKDHAPMITGVGMYIYWGIELAVIAGVALLLPWAAAREVYCEECQEWYRKAPLATLDLGKVPSAVEALATRDMSAFGACVGPGAGGYVTLQKCPSCQAAPLNVIVEASVRDQKGKETRKNVYEDLFSREEANRLIAAAATPPAAPPEKPAGT